MQFYFSNIFDIIIIPHDVVEETQAVDHVEVLSCVVVMTHRRSHDVPVLLCIVCGCFTWAGQ